MSGGDFPERPEFKKFSRDAFPIHPLHPTAADFGIAPGRDRTGPGMLRE